MAARIMAINDSQEILDMLGEILTDEGYEVSLHTSPALATVNLGDVKPDVIILDWLFGREDLGMQLLQRLKLRPSTATIPVIVCTAAVRHIQEIESYLQTKEVAVIFKPFTVEELLAAITTALKNDDQEAVRAEEEAFFNRLARVTPGGPRRTGS